MSKLTRREQEVLVLLAQGKVNKEIALKLGIGCQTVKNHIQHIYQKWGCRNRVEAVRIYLNGGRPTLYERVRGFFRG